MKISTCIENCSIKFCQKSHMYEIYVVIKNAKNSPTHLFLCLFCMASVFASIRTASFILYMVASTKNKIYLRMIKCSIGRTQGILVFNSIFIQRSTYIQKYVFIRNQALRQYIYREKKTRIRFSVLNRTFGQALYCMDQDA